MTASDAIWFSKSPQWATWCLEHRVNSDDVLAVSFGVRPPARVTEEHPGKDWARLWEYERDWGGRRVVEGSRGEERLKHAHPRYVMVEWRPKAAEVYRR